MFSDQEEKLPASCCVLFRRSLQEGNSRSCCGSDSLYFIYSPAPLPQLPLETCLHVAQSTTLISLTPSIVRRAFPSTRLSAALFCQRKNKDQLSAAFSQSESDGKHPAETIGTQPQYSGFLYWIDPTLMLWVLLVVTGFFSIYLLEKKCLLDSFRAKSLVF